MTLFQRLIAIRTGGGVERCHGVKHYGSYSVAAHSWGVAMLMYLLWPEDFPRLVIYCLVHDVPEAWTGDIPAHAKRYCPEIKVGLDRMERMIFDRLQLPIDPDLFWEDRAKLRACDHLELYCWAQEQVVAGNNHVRCVIRNLERFFAETPLLPDANSLYIEMRSGVSFEHDVDGQIVKEYASG